MRRLAVAVGAVLVLAVGGVAWAAIPNGDGNIYACYNTGDGSVRVKDDPAKPCAKGWSPLKWTASQPQIPPPPHIPVTTTYRLRSETRSSRTVAACSSFPAAMATLRPAVASMRHRRACGCSSQPRVVPAMRACRRHGRSGLTTLVPTAVRLPPSSSASTPSSAAT
jgi:hypothetical protein